MKTATIGSAHTKASHHTLGAEQASLLVRDMLGRVKTEVLLGQTAGIAELPLQTWPSGLYTATLSADGIPVGSVKLIVQR